MGLIANPAIANAIGGAALAAMQSLGRAFRRTIRSELTSKELRAEASRLTGLVAEKLQSQPLTSDHVSEELLDALRRYFDSPDFRVYFQHILTVLLSGRTTELAAMCEEELRSGLDDTKQLLPDDEPSVKVVNAFFFDLAESFVGRLREDYMSADEDARREVDRHVLAVRLMALSRRVAQGERTDTPTIAECQDFLERYKRVALQRHSEIVPPSLDEKRRIPIDRLYVAPDVIRQRRHIDLARDRVPTDINQFVSEIDRSVLLGDPGAGKSTLATKIAYDLLSHSEGRGRSSEAPIPLLIVLRDYRTHQAKHSSSIVEYLSTELREKYQIDARPRVVEWVLQTGRALLIFDGLDELLDTSYRQDVASSVEAFAELFPATPILVTSRRVGYREAPLSNSVFDTYEIGGFSEGAVEQYVRNWFALDPQLSAREREGLTDSFLRESQIVVDLRSNPLMLGLMCSIYRGERYIPRNRPDIYEKCALMLFERWDKGRGIRVDLPFEAHLRSTMQHLAFWIYGDSSKEGGVTREALVNEATDFLHERRFEHVDEARQAAESFIDFCKGRAWVFAETGTTPEGDPIFHFTHRTFLEYFAAAHLARSYDSTRKMLTFILRKVRRAEWDVVCQLAIQIRSRSEDRADDVSLTRIVRDATRSSRAVSSRKNLISFACRCLEFLVPSRSTVRNVVTVALDEALSDLDSGVHDVVGDSMLTSDRGGSLRSLANSAVENSATVSRCIADRFTNSAPGTPQRYWIAVFFAMQPSWTSVGNRTVPPWYEEVEEAFAEEMMGLAEDEHWAAVWCIFNGRSEPDALVASHGVERLLVSAPFPGHNMLYVPVAAVALRHVLTGIMSRSMSTDSVHQAIRLVGSEILGGRRIRELARVAESFDGLILLAPFPHDIDDASHSCPPDVAIMASIVLIFLDESGAMHLSDDLRAILEACDVQPPLLRQVLSAIVGDGSRELSASDEYAGLAGWALLEAWQQGASLVQLVGGVALNRE